MSAVAFNRLAALEAAVRALTERLNKLEASTPSQAREPERPHTLSIKRKADPSHA
jgi:hypothetical protein